MKPPLIFLIVVALIAVLATQKFFKQRREKAANDASPVRSLMVEVKTKREYLAPDRRSRQRDQLPVEDWRYEAWFHPLDGGEDLKLALSAGDYHQIDKGSRGELQVQGTRFIRFTLCRAPDGRQNGDHPPQAGGE
ncbi:DUF2500 domain-containing protein [Erwiniaceae bacterium CAU 1747]